jgi:hypothetical protein
MNESAIADAIAFAGGQIALRDALAEHNTHVTQQAISFWKTRGYAPANHHEAIIAAATLACMRRSGGTCVPPPDLLTRLAKDIETAALNRAAGG